MDRNTDATPADALRSLSTAVEELTRLGMRFMTGTLAAAQPLWSEYLRTWDGAVRRSPLVTEPRCKIPETECPPRCVCQLRWEAEQGQTVKGTIRLTNTGKDTRQFGLGAKTLSSPDGDTGVAPKLDKNHVTLAPGQEATIHVKIEVGEPFHAHRTYTSEILIRGRYEQCVLVRLDVVPQQRPHCNVEHGEIPTRIRAHQWYDHFQCEEPCFEPIRAKDQVIVPPDHLPDAPKPGNDG